MNILSLKFLPVFSTLLLPFCGQAQHVLLKQSFNGEPTDTNPTLYAGNSNSAGTAPNIVNIPGSTGLSGKGLNFVGSSSNSFVAANFDAVTLTKAGDYITFSYDYALAALPGAAQSGTNRIGIFNNGGTPLASDMFGPANPGQSGNNFGYMVHKSLSVNQTVDTNDYSWFEYAGPLVGTATSTRLGGGASGILVDTTNHTVSLTLMLAASGDLLVTYRYDSFSASYTVGAADITTTTFSEIYFAPAAGSSVGSYVNNLMVTSNIPEPSTAVLSAAALAFVVVLGCRRIARRR